MDDKPTLRRRFIERRMALSPEKRLSYAEAIRDRFLHGYGAQGIVAGYGSIKGEADPSALLSALHSRGHGIALPVIAEGFLTFRSWSPGASLTTNRYGIAEPDSGDPVVPALILVPLVAFDSFGHRLGYGGGYYDRTLSRPPYDAVPRIGIAYEFQKVDRLPSEAHDVTVDAVVTEVTVHRFTRF